MTLAESWAIQAAGSGGADPEPHLCVCEMNL